MLAEILCAQGWVAADHSSCSFVEVPIERGRGEGKKRDREGGEKEKKRQEGDGILRSASKKLINSFHK